MIILARNLAETLGYILFDVNKIVKEKNFTENYDETYDTYILGTYIIIISFFSKFGRGTIILLPMNK